VSTPARSYLKVPYDLRPAKQVERRMIVEALHALSLQGFPIRDYLYTGMGSVFFVDFILFHRMLGIRRMLSVEADSAIERRIRFNRPFGCVQITMNKIGNVIPTLSKDQEHLLWLDYDSIIDREHLEDIWLAAAHLSKRSILLVTVDVEPPVESGEPRSWKRYFDSECPEYLGGLRKAKDFAQSNLPSVNREIIANCIASGVSGRGVQFLPLFSFSYADGHEMLTFGGMIGSEEDRVLLKARLSRAEFAFATLSLNQPLYRISVPVLTRKERLYLDREMPCPKRWKPKDFELPNELIERYRQIYRYYPVYAELMM
jgi:hypothetical protein